MRVRDTYVSIAEECFGPRYGGRMVNLAQLIELLMTCILYVVLCGDLMVGTFPDGSIDTRSWMMLCGILLLPCSFLKNLHHVSTLSFWCTMAHVAINVIILGYCLLQAATWGWSHVPLRINIFTFPISLGIIVFSYTSQIFLPSLEGNMKDPSRFHCMLNWSHIAAAIFKSLFGYVGFLTWTENTQEVITNNLPTQGFKGLVNFILVVKVRVRCRRALEAARPSPHGGAGLLDTWDQGPGRTAQFELLVFRVAFRHRKPLGLKGLLLFVDLRAKLACWTLGTKCPFRVASRHWKPVGLRRLSLFVGLKGG